MLSRLRLSVLSFNTVIGPYLKVWWQVKCSGIPVLVVSHCRTGCGIAVSRAVWLRCNPPVRQICYKGTVLFNNTQSIQQYYNWYLNRNSCFFLGQGNNGIETTVCVGALGSAFLPKYNSGERIKNNGTGRTCSAHGERKVAYRILVGNPEWKRPLGRPRRKYGDNINPLPALTFWNGRNLNVPCRPKRSKTVLLSSS